MDIKRPPTPEGGTDYGEEKSEDWYLLNIFFKF